MPHFVRGMTLSFWYKNITGWYLFFFLGLTNRCAVKVSEKNKWNIYIYIFNLFLIYMYGFSALPAISISDFFHIRSFAM